MAVHTYIPSISKAKAGMLKPQGYTENSKFSRSEDYIVRTCLKTKQNQIKTKSMFFQGFGDLVQWYSTCPQGLQIQE